MRKLDIEAILHEHIDSFIYGAAITEVDFQDMFGVDVISDESFDKIKGDLSKSSLCKIIQDEAFSILQVSDLVRDILHLEGKHFHKVGNCYRVALPSENEKYANRYRTRAAKNIKKANILTEHSPKVFDGSVDSGKSINFLMKN